MNRRKINNSGSNVSISCSNVISATNWMTTAGQLA